MNEDPRKSTEGVIAGMLRSLEGTQQEDETYITIISYRSEIVEIFDFGAVFLLSGHTGKGSKMSYD